MRLHTVEALERILSTSGPDTQIWDYGGDFNDLWNLDMIGEIRHAIVVWSDTPADPSVSPIDTERHLTPLDWAIAARARNEAIRVSVIDLRPNQHDGGKYAALHWFRTQKPKCVPWLRRLVLADLLDLSTASDLREFLVLEERDASIPDVPVVRAQDALKLLPACRVDLTHDAGHHAIANLVGPLLLLRKSKPPTQFGAVANHRAALRHLLSAAGFVLDRRLEDDADELADGGSRFANTIGEHLGEIRLVLCDDQWNHGWLDWLCERVGASIDAASVQRVDAQADGRPQEVATGERVSIWVSSRPDWLVPKLNELSWNTPPLQRRLHLTSKDEARDEVLLLDLRLFAERRDTELAFLESLQRVHDGLRYGIRSEGASQPAAPARDGAASTNNTLSLLPQTLALADPLLPLVLFSSTGRRDVIKMVSDCPNIVTHFAKPRLLGDGTGDLRRATEEAFDQALKDAALLVRRRRVIGDLQAAHRRLEAPAMGASYSEGRILEASKFSEPKRYGYVGVYVDESGSVHRPNQPFVMAAIVALCRDRNAAKSLREALKTQVTWGKGFGSTAEARRELANSVLGVARSEGSVLRGLAITRGSPFPEGPAYGPNALWAETALDRVHRLLLKQLIASALAYVVRPDEVAANAKCAILTDVRSVPVTELRLNPPDLLKFGIEILDADSRRVSRKRIQQGAPERDWKWAFLNTSGVYPIVEDVFMEESRLRSKFTVDEARACKGLYDGGHPLVEWADYLANAVFRAHDREGRLVVDNLESWTRELLAPPALVASYDVNLERLLSCARLAADGQVSRAVQELVDMTDRCADEGSLGLADRCRSFIASELERQYSPARARPNGGHGGGVRDKTPAKADGVQTGSFTGAVKWFDTQKGYGFVSRDDGSEVFVHVSALLGDGFRELNVGERVTFEITTGRKGPQAINVRRSAPATVAHPPDDLPIKDSDRPAPVGMSADVHPPDQLAEAEFESPQDRRVHELGKEFGVSSEEVIARLERLGISGKRSQSTLSQDELRRLLEDLGVGQRPQPTVGTERTIATEDGAVVERRVDSHVIRRRPLGSDGDK